jgi:hypothetical protein
MLAGTLPVALAPIAVYASGHLSIEDAQQAAFSTADRFTPTAVSLTGQQRQQVQMLAGPQSGHGNLQVWQVAKGDVHLGYFFVDEVIGRQALITYAVGIDANGAFGTPEVLAYRESHGGEIRNRSWRRQFEGRKDLAALRFGIDIKNIAGATMSAEHLTQGMRWLHALWQVALHPGARTP